MSDSFLYSGDDADDVRAAGWHRLKEQSHTVSWDINGIAPECGLTFLCKCTCLRHVRANMQILI